MSLTRLHAGKAALARLPLGMMVGALGGLGVRGLELAGKFGLYLMVARVLGPNDAGLFFLCLTWVTVASTAGRLGFERAMTRHVSAELAVGHGAAALAAMRHGLLATAAGGAAAAILTAALAGPASRLLFGKPGLAWPLALSGLAMLPQALAISAGAVLIALRRPVGAQLVQNAVWPVLTLAAVLGGVARLDALIWILAGAITAGGLLGAALLWRDRGRFAIQAAGAAHAVLPPLWRTARPLLLVELVQVSLVSLPVLVLGVFADAASVGAFSTANRISTLVWVVMLSVATVAAPAFAEHHRRSETAQLRSANRSARLAVAVFGLPLLLVMLLIPASLLRLVGPAYTVASAALVVLAAGQVVNALLSCQDVLLAMTGHGSVLRILSTLQFVSCAVLSAVLIPEFGMMGAAVVTAVCTAQGAIGTTLGVRRVMPGVF